MNNLKKGLIEKLKNNNNFIITTHENSDGDGLGTQFALYQYLKSLGKNVEMLNEDFPQEKYAFLGFNQLVKKELIIRKENNEENDPYVIMVDCNEKSRIGESLQYIFRDDSKLIRIDHHRNPEEIPASFSIIDENASSVCEILFYLLRDEVKNFDEQDLKKWANCLYSGIIFDTNNFTNSNVSPGTFYAVSELKRFGAEHRLCYMQMFEDKSNNILKLLGETLSTIEEILDGKLVIYHTTQKMLKNCNLKSEATEGFTKEVRPDNGRQVVIYIRETDNEYCRVSLRSNGLNVQKIAGEFGGGGHKVASGFKVKMDLEPLKKKLIEIVTSKMVRN
ncbi:MAG: bifunctional oligoribonuclease/PAP phosphatase NrnA [Candidatus Cloacimonadota bacterium]|nr:bifunctional oligoribonuclease/PAP phosphatase NrnA [Candidatus Cloacimonadota bacterium]